MQNRIAQFKTIHDASSGVCMERAISFVAKANSDQSCGRCARLTAAGLNVVRRFSFNSSPRGSTDRIPRDTTDRLMLSKPRWEHDVHLPPFQFCLVHLSSKQPNAQSCSTQHSQNSLPCLSSDPTDQFFSQFISELHRLTVCFQRHEVVSAPRDSHTFGLRVAQAWIEQPHSGPEIIHDCFNCLLRRCARVSQPAHGLQQFPKMSWREDFSTNWRMQQHTRNVQEREHHFTSPSSLSLQSRLLTIQFAVPPAEASVQTQMLQCGVPSVVTRFVS